MKPITFLLSLSFTCTAAMAQTYAPSVDYRVCPAELTEKGKAVVESSCGTLAQPDFSALEFASLSDLQSAQNTRDAFQTTVSTYSSCVSRFVESFRRPGAPADSPAPDQAACAHSWAQDVATQNVRQFGRACISFADKSIIDTSLEPYTGQCYLSADTGRG